MVEYEKISPSVHFLNVARKKSKYKTKFEVIFTRGGSFFEDRNVQGVSHFMEHCIASTFGNWKATDLNKYLETKGISRNAGTGTYLLKTEVTGHSSDEQEIFDILKNITFDPKISEETLENERNVIVAEIGQRTGSPQYQLGAHIDKQMYTSDSPTVYEVLGTVDHVKNTKMEDIDAAYSRMISNSNMLFLGVGVSNKLKEEIVALINSKKDLFKPNHQIHERPVSTFNDFTYLPIVHKYARDNARITVLIPCNVGYENQGSRHLLNRLLIKGTYGYLYNTLREKMQIIYHLNSSFMFPLNYLQIEMVANIEHVEKAIEVIRNMFDTKIINDTRKDFQLIKKSYLKWEQIQNEDQYYSEINEIASNLYSFGIPYTSKDYLTLIKKTTFQDVLKIHSELKQQIQNMRIVVVSNKDKIGNLILF
jgi:predicted Zn-dependent peptidase